MNPAAQVAALIALIAGVSGLAWFSGATNERLARASEPPGCVDLRLTIPGAAVLTADGATVARMGR